MKIIYRFILILIFAFLLHYGSFSQNHRSGDTIQAHIDVDSAFSIVQANANNPDFIILDVRTSGEYNIYHLWNGVLLDYNSPTFDSMLNTLDKNKTYLVHCASGGRSTNAFNLMKSKEFKIFYNMLGGIGGWNSAGYPTTDSIRPVFMSVSDTLLQFDSLVMGETDTIPITITNFGNGLLKLNALAGISGTDFVTDFIPGTEISGLYDYTFNIVFQPSDQIPDSIVIILTSNGGEQQYILKGANKASSLEEVKNEQISIYPNPSSGIFYVKGKNIERLEVYMLNGQRIQPNHIDLIYDNIIELDMSNLAKGCYLLLVKTGINYAFKTIIVN